MSSVDTRIPEWRPRAACKGMDLAIFFPDGPARRHSLDEARAVCRACPVITECLADALDHDDRYGMRGGLSRKERQALKKNTALKKQAAA